DSSQLYKYTERLIAELKTAMFLVGAQTVNDLRNTKLVITGFTREWLVQRSIDTKMYAQRQMDNQQ
ncbi:MAG: type 2 isopentenyl-diphosphate Delta-isomerase, partial [Candidatus Ranarchaeia archaeon]